MTIMSEEKMKNETAPVLQPLQPKYRLLLGPGPSNVPPRVAAAGSMPMISHVDPAFYEVSCLATARFIQDRI